MYKLKPDKIITKIYSKNYIKLEKKLHKKYKHLMIAKTEYFD